jgi:hypothetical protein
MTKKNLYIFSNSNFNTPRLLHLYDGGGPPSREGIPQKAD